MFKILKYIIIIYNQQREWNRMPNNKNNFIYKGKIIYCFIKDIELKEVRGKEMANTIMVIYVQNDNQKDFFSAYDEKDKVLYATPSDALRWFEKF